MLDRMNGFGFYWYYSKSYLGSNDFKSMKRAIKILKGYKEFSSNSLSPATKSYY